MTEHTHSYPDEDLEQAAELFSRANREFDGSAVCQSIAVACIAREENFSLVYLSDILLSKLGLWRMAGVVKEDAKAVNQRRESEGKRPLPVPDRHLPETIEEPLRKILEAAQVFDQETHFFLRDRYQDVMNAVRLRYANHHIHEPITPGEDEDEDEAKRSRAESRLEDAINDFIRGLERAAKKEARTA